MDQISKNGGSHTSATTSTPSHSPKPATLNDHRMLTPSELEFLRLKQREIAFVHQVLLVRTAAISLLRTHVLWEVLRDKISDVPPADWATPVQSISARDTGQALAERCIAEALRLASRPSSSLDRPSLPSLADTLKNDTALRVWLASAERAPRYADTLSQGTHDTERRAAAIERFLSAVPPDATDGSPGTTNLERLRTKIVPMQRSLPPFDSAAFPHAQVQWANVRDFTHLILEIISDISVVVANAPIPADLFVTLERDAHLWWAPVLR
jgi:hypothetical protein